MENTMSITTLCCTYDIMLLVHFSSSCGADAKQRLIGRIPEKLQGKILFNRLMLSSTSNDSFVHFLKILHHVLQSKMQSKRRFDHYCH